MSSRLVIVNYGMGNLNSVKRAMSRLRVDSIISSKPKIIAESDKIIQLRRNQASVIYDEGEISEHNFGAESDADYYVEDTITHRKFHTSSLVYRKEIRDRVGGIPKNILSNERAIYPMLAISGKIKYFSKAMCIYRKSSLGISSRISSQELETDLNMIPWLEKITSGFPIYKFKSFLHLCVYTYPARIKITQLIKHYILFIMFSFSYFPENLGDAKHGNLEFIQIFKNMIRWDALKHI